MSDTVLAVTGKDFVLMAADAKAGFSIIMMKDSEDKISEMDNNKILGAVGEGGDRVQFCEYISKNFALYRFRNDRALDTKSAGHFLRQELATALRKKPYQVNMLLGGHDEGIGPSLYFIDYLASMQKVNFGAHGYGSYFSLSIMDKYYKKDMNVDEAKELLRKCIAEVQKRLILNSPNFVVKIVDKDGTRPVSLYDEEQD